MRAQLASVLGWWWWSSNPRVAWWWSRAVSLGPWPRECCSNTRRRRAQGSTGPPGIVETSEHSGRWHGRASGLNRQRLAKGSSIRPRSGDGHGWWSSRCGVVVGRVEVPGASGVVVEGPAAVDHLVVSSTHQCEVGEVDGSAGEVGGEAVRWWASVQWDGRGQSGTRQPRSRCLRARRWARFAKRVVRPRSRISDPLVTTRRRAASMSQGRIHEGGTGP